MLDLLLTAARLFYCLGGLDQSFEQHSSLVLTDAPGRVHRKSSPRAKTLPKLARRWRISVRIG
jgi:hypothetical protein